MVETAHYSHPDSVEAETMGCKHDKNYEVTDNRDHSVINTVHSLEFAGLVVDSVAEVGTIVANSKQAICVLLYIVVEELFFSYSPSFDEKAVTKN